MKNKNIYKNSIIIIAGFLFFFSIIFVVIWWFGLGSNVSQEAYIKIDEVAFEVDVVATPAALAKGLSGREDLSSNEGMLFVFSKVKEQTFWMKGMKIPIDLIWIKDDVVVGFEKILNRILFKNINHMGW